MEEKIRNFVQSDYYIKAFEGKSSLFIGFNFFAALFGTVWFLYRKMWLFAFLCLVESSLLLLVVAPQITKFLPASNEFDIGYWIVLILNRLLIGLIANSLYFWHAKNKISKLYNKDNGEDLASFIQKRGGTSIVGVAIPIALLVCLNFVLLSLESI